MNPQEFRTCILNQPTKKNALQKKLSPNLNLELLESVFYTKLTSYEVMDGKVP